MTWSLRTREAKRPLFLSHADEVTDPYRGDTTCRARLPLLCVKPGKAPTPEGITPDFYHGWLGGQARLSTPWSGTKLTSLAKANELCADEFGNGWRMGEFHDRTGADRGGWGFWSYGMGARVWIKDPKNSTSHPWNAVSGRALTWVQTRAAKGSVQDFEPDYLSNATWGDTPVDHKLPVLCVEPPKDAGRKNKTRAALSIDRTYPVLGSDLTDDAAADKTCSTAFGSGWRMATTSDATDATITGTATTGRTWVAINDQPANPWDPHQRLTPARRS